MAQSDFTTQLLNELNQRKREILNRQMPQRRHKAHQAGWRVSLLRDLRDFASLFRPGLRTA